MLQIFGYRDRICRLRPCWSAYRKCSVFEEKAKPGELNEEEKAIMEARLREYEANPEARIVARLHAK